MTIYVRCPHCKELTLNKLTGDCEKARAEQAARG